MPSLCLTFYRPLLEFYTSLHNSFSFEPMIEKNFQSLKRACETQDKALLGKLGPGLTKDLLRRFLSRDVSFFADDNPFVQFIGGKDVYDQFDEAERDMYWGAVLENVIRQGIIAYALFPKMGTLESLASNLMDGSDSAKSLQNPMHLMQNVMNNPETMSDVMSLIDGKDGIKDLMGMLKSIVHGVSDVEESPGGATDKDAPDVDALSLFADDLSIRGGGSSSTATNATPADTNAVDDDIAPSDIFKKLHTDRKKEEKKRVAPGIDTMYKLIDDVSDEQLQEMQQDVNAMSPDEMQAMMSEVCGILETTNTDNPMDALSTLASSLGDVS